MIQLTPTHTKISCGVAQSYINDEIYKQFANEEVTTAVNTLSV